MGIAIPMLLLFLFGYALTLGEFIELEVDSDDVEAGKKAIFALMKEIGVSGNERRSYLELLMEKADSRNGKMN